MIVNTFQDSQNALTGIKLTIHEANYPFLSSFHHGQNDLSLSLSWLTYDAILRHAGTPGGTKTHYYAWTLFTSRATFKTESALNSKDVQTE